MFLSIPYADLPINYDDVFDICIDYADNTLRGILKYGILMGSEITILKFSDYGIFVDNRYGNGYEIYDGDETHLTILFKNNKN